MGIHYIWSVKYFTVAMIDVKLPTLMTALRCLTVAFLGLDCDWPVPNATLFFLCGR